MLRVCGITLDHTVNYGSCFQAYALQKAVEGIQLSDGSTSSYTLIPIRTFREWNSKRSVISMLLLPIISLYRRKFVGFENKYMHFTKSKSLSDLPALNDETDVFMCGSDVIWNPDFNHNLNAFYLDFAKKYKFSYAASFGKAEISDQQLSATKDYLEELNTISIREKNGLEIIRRCLDKPVKVVADPVFLLTKDEWNSIMPALESIGKYIFVYMTHLSETANLFIDNLKKRTGLRVIISAIGPKQVLKMKALQIQTPDEWLRLISNAEYVVTNSFHATAFSIMFHKKFFTVVNGDKAKGINIRMNDLLTELGLENRIFAEIPNEIDLGEIDYLEIDKKIETMRNNSLEFIQKNLEAAYQQKRRIENSDSIGMQDADN